MIDTITKIQIITRKTKFQELIDALNEIGVNGMTVTEVYGYGTQKGDKQYFRGVPMDVKLLAKIQLEIVVSEVLVEKVIEVAERILRTGEIGDGKIFISDVKQAVRVRTGERGKKALADE